MKAEYSYLEVEAIETNYDEQVPLKVIAEQVNLDFHQGTPVRTTNSIKYVVNRLNTDDEWKANLEDKWLKSIEK